MAEGQGERILVVDDVPTNVRLLVDLLAAEGYGAESAPDGATALAAIARQPPVLVLLDVMMPGIDGIEVLRRIRADDSLVTLPVVMVTALEERELRLRALQIGADDFLSKPIDRHELRARVRSLLRVQRLYRRSQQLAGELAALNAQLEQRVAAQVEQLQRLARLKRFFSPRLAELLVGDESEGLLASHRREIVVVFLDLRGYSSFADEAEPEEVMAALEQFHAAMGTLIHAAEGTLERFTGDGMMVFFNDPVPMPDAAQRALAMALAMQRDFALLAEGWRARGHELGLGIGIARGYATLGRIGFAGRIDYGAIGAVTNLAQRLCDLAAPGEILCTRAVLAGTEAVAETRGSRALAGFARPVEVFALTALQPRAVAVN